MASLALAAMCGCVVACTCRGTTRHQGMLAPVAASLGATLVLWAQANSPPSLATAAQLVLPLMGGALMIAALMVNRRMLNRVQ